MTVKRLLLVCLMILCLLPLCGRAADDALYPIRENSLWGYMDRAGETVIEPRWNYAGLFRQGVAMVGVDAGEEEEEPEYTYGLLRSDGTMLLPAEYLIVEYTDGFKYSAWDEEAGYYAKDGFFDLKSGFLLPPVYDHLWNNSGELLTAAEWTDDDWIYGFIRRDTGEMVFPLQFDGLYDDVGCYEGYVLAAYEKGLRGDGSVWGPEYHLYTLDGEEILFPEGMVPWSGVRDGVLILEHYLTDEEASVHTTGWGEVYGLGKADGTVIVEPMYDYIDYANDGLYSIMLDDLCGVMDGTGNVIVPPVYAIFTGGPPPGIYFNGCGYAVIDDVNTGRVILIDREGRELYSVPFLQTDPETGEDRYNGILPPSENGCFWVYSYTYPGDGHYRTENNKYLQMRIMNDQVIAVSGSEYDSVFDGVRSADCAQQEENFAEGLQAVSMNGLWGYVDENGLMALPFQWDAAANFYNGLALVEKDGKLLYIDHDGAVVWEEK